jgi:alpha-beta hydrolase superfamily lysophospholipase
MNLATDFEFQTFQLQPDYEGEATATLISSKFNTGRPKAVLYLHGFIDYFFHPHVTEKFIDEGYDFFALDLRKYGRSLMPHQRPNYCANLNEYFEEISMAIQQIQDLKERKIFLYGHSTGGLIAVSYVSRSKRNKDPISGLILNAPFFDFYQSRFEKMLIGIIAPLISSIFPYAKVNGALSTVYPKSIHKNYFGEWDFNLNWKPIKGFPTYFKWILAIRKAQKKLLNTRLKLPILVMHPSKTVKTKKFSEVAKNADIVLNIEDMKRVGKQLGEQVTLLQVENALHDIFLSSIEVREMAFIKMFDWLENQ